MSIHVLDRHRKEARHLMPMSISYFPDDVKINSVSEFEIKFTQGCLNRKINFESDNANFRISNNTQFMFFQRLFLHA